LAGISGSIFKGQSLPVEAMWKTVNSETGEVVITDGVFIYEENDPRV